MHDEGKRVAHVAVDEHIQAHEVALLISVRLVVKRGIAAGAGFQTVEEIVDYLVQRQPIGHLHAGGIHIGHVDEDAALLLAELHDLPHILRRGVDGGFDDGLLYALDLPCRRQIGGIVDDELFAVGPGDVIGHPWRGGDEVEVELALQPLLYDLHVQQPQEPAAETEAERLGIFRLEGEGRIVELELEKGFFEVVIPCAVRGIDPRKDHGRDLLITLQRSGCGTVGKGDGVADGGVRDILYARGDITHLTRRKRGCGTHSGCINPDFNHIELFARREHPDAVARFHGAVHDAHHGDSAAVVVVIAVKD